MNTRKALILVSLVSLVWLFCASVVVVFADETLNWASSGTDPLSFGRNDAQTMIAQSFTPTANWTTANGALRLGRSASNSRDIYFTIQTDSGSNTPSGVVLATSTLSESGLVTSDSDCGAAVDTSTGDLTGMTLVSGTKYWLVLSTSALSSYAGGVPFACGGAYTPVARYLDGTWQDWTSKGLLYSITLSGTPVSPDVPLGGATSTLEQAQSNLAMAFWLFLACFFGVVWLLRKH